MEGPYGSLSLDIDDVRYKTALCVSGGIGVTPCQSIGKSLLHQHRVLGRQLKNFRFVWAVRNTKIVRDIPPLGGTEDFSKNSILCQRQSQLIERSVASLAVGTNESNSSSVLSSPSNKTSSTVRTTRRQLPAVIQCDIYCTRRCPNDNDDDLEVPSTLLPYNVYNGRPDIDAIFRQMKQTAIDTGEHNIMVFACGPKSLLREVEEACRQHSESIVGCGDGVFFDLHIEHFEF